MVELFNETHGLRKNEVPSRRTVEDIDTGVSIHYQDQEVPYHLHVADHGAFFDLEIRHNQMNTTETPIRSIGWVDQWQFDARKQSLWYMTNQPDSERSVRGDIRFYTPSNPSIIITTERDKQRTPDDIELPVSFWMEMLTDIRCLQQATIDIDIRDDVYRALYAHAKHLDSATAFAARSNIPLSELLLKPRLLTV